MSSDTTRSSRTDLRSEVKHLLLIVLIALGAAYYGVMIRNVLVYQHLGDFGRMYYSARLFLAGDSLYGRSPVAFSDPPGAPIANLNPPHAEILFLPIAGWPEPVAFCFGLAVAAISSVLAWRVGSAALGLRGTRLTGGIVAALLAWSPLQAVAATGQLFALYLVWPAACAWRSLRTERWRTAGFWLGLLVSVKPFLAPLLLLLVPRGRRRGLLTAMGTVVLAVVLGSLMFGWHAYIEWGAQLSEVKWPGLQLNTSVLGTLTRAFDPSAVYHPGLKPPLDGPSVRSFATVCSCPSLVTPLHVVLSLMIGVVALAALRHGLRMPDSTDRGWLVLLLAALLLSPLGWMYYLPLAVPAALAMWRSTRRRRMAVLLAAGMFLPLSLVDVAQPHALATMTLDSIYMWSVFGLWALVCWDTFQGAPGD